MSTLPQNLVKVCGLTNAEDALAAVAAGANAAGFIFYAGSPRFVTPAVAAGIAELLPAHVCKVGVFVDTGFSEVRRICEQAALDVAQMHGAESAGEPAWFRVWLAARVFPGWRIPEISGAPPEALLLDTPSAGRHGGSGRSFDWTLIGTIQSRFVLAGGLEAGNVERAIRTVRPWGVDACSLLESSPGRKDHDKVRRFVKAALAGYSQ